MKRNIGIIFTLAITALTVFVLTSSNGQVTADNETPNMAMAASCPIGTVTIQGCISLNDGCYTVATSNGRTIYVNLSSVSVGDGDIASMTGTFIGDQDCDPCVLKVTSATDLGNC